MQYCLCSVELAGSKLHVIGNKLVTIPEILILKHLHGKDAVKDIRLTELPEGHEGYPGDDEHREFLLSRYENAAPEEERGFIARLFPEAQPFPITLRAIGIDPNTEAARLREEAKKALAAAAALDASDDEPGDAAGAIAAAASGKRATLGVANKGA